MNRRLHGNSIMGRYLLLIGFIFTTLVIKAQYSGYVGDQFNIPDPPDRSGYTAMNATFGTTSSCLYVSSYGTVQIRSYFTGSHVVFCNVLYVRSDGKPGGNVPATVNYYVTCNARNITGLPSSVSMEEGEEKTLNWSISPYSANAKIDWISDDPSIVSVNSNGKLTAKSAGTTIVTAQNNSGPNQYVQVTVKEDNTPVVFASMESGTVEKGTQVTLSCNKANAEIYYTTDGTNPSNGSTRYTSPIVINETFTLKAIAYAGGYQSSVLVRNYKIRQEKIILSANPPGGTVEKGTVIKLIASVSDADIYYTMDGNSPTISSTPYQSTGIVINEGCTLKARAYKEGYDESDILTEKYYFDISADSVIVTVPAKTLFKGEKMEASYTLIPKNSNSTVVWTSDNPNIATVDKTSGEIEGKKEGVTYIRATTDNGKTDFCKIEIKTRKSSSTFNDGIGIASVSAGYNHTLFVKKDGTLWACGSSKYGQIGDGSYQRRRLSPVKVLDDVKMASASFWHTMVVKNDGTLWACGYNESGQLGESSSEGYHCITLRKITDHVVSVSAGSKTSLILKDDETLWSCGINTGDGTSNKRLTPVKIMNDVLCASTSMSGDAFSYVVKKDGSLWTFGTNRYGQLCDGTSTNRYSPVHIMDSISYVSTTEDGALVLKSTGKLVECKYGNIREISDSVIFAAGKNWHSVFIKEDGSLWGYGSNSNNCLTDEDNGPYNDNYAPSVKLMDDIASAEVGPYRTFIIKKDGTLWARGENDDGELGDGTIYNRERAFKLIDVDSNLLPYSISISSSLLSLEQGAMRQLSCSIDPQDFPVTVKWTSDDTTIAVVDSLTGVVTAIKPGITFINAATDNGVTDWCKIIVTRKQLENEFYYVGTLNEWNVTDKNYKFKKKSDGETWELTMKTSSDDEFKIAIGSTNSWDGNLYGVPAENDPSSKTGKMEYDFNGSQNFSVKAIPNMFSYTVRINPSMMSYEISTNTPKTITLSSAGYATFYDSTIGYQLPDNLKANVITSAANNKLTYSELEDDVLPAGIAVMLKNDIGKTSSYTLYPTESTTTYTGTNLLRGSDEATTTTGDGYHYKLSYGPSSSGWNNVFGWYWGGQNGAPFQIEGHKAWLVVPKSSGSRGYAIDSDATGIGIVDADEANESYYDLQGRRINTPVKNGVYIQNGRKVIVK